MGNLFGNCFKARDSGAPTNNNHGSGSKGGELQSQPMKDRVTEQDKAVLDVKSRMRKIKTYVDKLALQIDQQNDKIKEYLKEKQKQRALIALKHKKFLEKEFEKATGAQSMLQQTITNIESAQMDVQVMEALKQGDQVITELQSKASMEDFEELYERHQEQQDRMEMEQEFFGQVFNDEELEDELNALDAEIVDMQIPDAPKDFIEIDVAAMHVEQQASQEVQQPVKQKEKRQMLPA